MSDLLSIGASGVRAYQTALSTVSENIANTGTVGYTRRTTTLAEVSSVNGGINARNSATGSGVVVVGVGRRMWRGMLAATLRRIVGDGDE